MVRLNDNKRVFDLTQEGDTSEDTVANDNEQRISIDPSLRIRELRLSTRFTNPIQDGVRKILIRVSPRWQPKKDEKFDFFVRDPSRRTNNYVFWKRAVCTVDPIPVLITYAKQVPVLCYDIDPPPSKTCSFILNETTAGADEFATDHGFQDFEACTRFFHTIKDRDSGNIRELTEIIIYDLHFSLEVEEDGLDVDAYQDSDWDDNSEDAA